MNPRHLHCYGCPDATSFYTNSTTTTTSSNMFAKALGPIHGFNHARLAEEPLVGGLYLKPFVYRQHHPLLPAGKKDRAFRNPIGDSFGDSIGDSIGDSFGDSFVLDDLNITTTQLATDLVHYIERATTASAIVSGELHGSAKMQAEAKVHDHTLGVLYSLKGNWGWVGVGWGWVGVGGSHLFVFLLQQCRLC